MEAVAEFRLSGGIVIATSFLVAMVLMIIPFPNWMPSEIGYLRPDWVVLVLIYWVIAVPERIGVVTAWIIGLFMDVLLGSLLGQHAISMTLVAYLASSLYQRLRMFSVWQQSLVVFATVGLHELVNFWIESLAGLRDWNLWYLMSSVVSAFFWPWIFLLLRYFRRRFDIH